MATHIYGHSEPDRSLRTLVADVRASAAVHGKLFVSATESPPFVTISRQAGSGGKSLAENLAARLNALEPEAERPWTAWDREVVEKVAADHHLSADLIAQLSESGKNWVEQFFGDMAMFLDS